MEKHYSLSQAAKLLGMGRRALRRGLLWELDLAMPRVSHGSKLMIPQSVLERLLARRGARRLEHPGLKRPWLQGETQEENRTDIEKWYTLSAAAKFAGVDPQTLRRWFWRELSMELPCLRRGVKFMIRQSDLERLLATPKPSKIRKAGGAA